MSEKQGPSPNGAPDKGVCLEENWNSRWIQCSMLGLNKLVVGQTKGRSKGSRF